MEEKQHRKQKPSNVRPFYDDFNMSVNNGLIASGPQTSCNQQISISSLCKYVVIDDRRRHQRRLQRPLCADTKGETPLSSRRHICMRFAANVPPQQTADARRIHSSIFPPVSRSTSTKRPRRFTAVPHAPPPVALRSLAAESAFIGAEVHQGLCSLCNRTCVCMAIPIIAVAS